VPRGTDAMPLGRTEAPKPPLRVAAPLHASAAQGRLPWPHAVAREGGARGGNHRVVPSSALAGAWLFQCTRKLAARTGVRRWEELKHQSIKGD
jgi:hypothetical protein